MSDAGQGNQPGDRGGTLTSDVKLTPSRRWEGARGKEKASLLGLSVRVCNPAAALESVWHILEVLEGSPAEVGPVGVLS